MGGRAYPRAKRCDLRKQWRLAGTLALPDLVCRSGSGTPRRAPTGWPFVGAPLRDGKFALVEDDNAVDDGIEDASFQFESFKRGVTSEGDET